MEFGETLRHFLSICPNLILLCIFITLLFPLILSHFGLTLVSLFMSWPPKLDNQLPKTCNEDKVEPFLHLSSSKVEFFKVSGNRSGTSSSFWINRRWVFHLRICLGVENIFGSKVVLHCSRPYDLEYLGIFLFCYILNIYVYKTTVCGELLREKNFENH